MMDPIDLRAGQRQGLAKKQKDRIVEALKLSLMMIKAVSRAMAIRRRRELD